MTLVIFHYHFLPGGVTDVVVKGIKAVLSGNTDIREIVLVSGRDTFPDDISEISSVPVKRVVVGEIDYSEKTGSGISSGTLADNLLNRFGGSDTVWWIHNYHLGKNIVFTKAVIRCAEAGIQRMVLYIHDFPECARFSNLKKVRKIRGILYPIKENVRYVVINSRDYGILINAGIPKNRLFLLHDPVFSSDRGKPADPSVFRKAFFERYKKAFPALVDDAPLFLYPVRCIRRKNVLEAGLLARLWPGGANLVLSLPGVSADEKSYSDLTENAFRKGLIPGVFGTGRDPDTEILNYRNLQTSCDCVVSTSLLEGFGYLYINSLLWKKPAVFRDLDILDGFRGIFDNYPAGFFPGLRIPLNNGERNTLKNQYENMFRDLRKITDGKTVKSIKNNIFGILDNDVQDFSFLSSDMQIDILSKLSDRSFYNDCFDLNSSVLTKLAETVRKPVTDKTVEIQKMFGEKTYSENIDMINSSFLKNPAAAKQVDNIRGKVLDSFSLPGYFRLLFFRKA